MRPICYIVCATLPGDDVAREYVEWLVNGHVQAVMAGGACEARVVRLDSEAGTTRIESAYLFPDRASFETYLSDHAPELRAQGLARFGSTPGVAFERRVGTVLFPDDGSSPEP